MTMKEGFLLEQIKSQINASREQPLSPRDQAIDMERIMSVLREPHAIPGMGYYDLTEEPITGGMGYAAYALFQRAGAYDKYVVGISGANKVPRMIMQNEALMQSILSTQLPQRLIQGGAHVMQDNELEFLASQQMCEQLGAPSLMLALTWYPQVNSTIPRIYTIAGMSPGTGLEIIQHAAQLSLEKFQKKSP